MTDEDIDPSDPRVRITRRLFKIPEEFDEHAPATTELVRILDMYGGLLQQANAPIYQHLALVFRRELPPVLSLVETLQLATKDSEDTVSLLTQLQNNLEVCMDAYYELPVDTLIYDMVPNMELFLTTLRTGLKKSSILLPPGKCMAPKAKRVGKYETPVMVTRKVAYNKTASFDEFGWPEIGWPVRTPASREAHVHYVTPPQEKDRDHEVPSGIQYRGGGVVSGLIFNRWSKNKTWKKHTAGCHNHVKKFKDVLEPQMIWIKTVYEQRDLCRMLASLLEAVTRLHKLHKACLELSEDFLEFILSPKELPTTIDRMLEIAKRVPLYNQYLEDVRKASLHPALSEAKQKELFEALSALDEPWVAPAMKSMLTFFETTYIMFDETSSKVDDFDVKGFVLGYMFEKLPYSDGLNDLIRGIMRFSLPQVKKSLQWFSDRHRQRPDLLAETRTFVARVGQPVLETQLPIIEKALTPFWRLGSVVLNTLRQYTSQLKPRDLHQHQAGYTVSRVSWAHRRKEVDSLALDVAEEYEGKDYEPGHPGFALEAQPTPSELLSKEFAQGPGNKLRRLQSGKQRGLLRKMASVRIPHTIEQAKTERAKHVPGTLTKPIFRKAFEVGSLADMWALIPEPVADEEDLKSDLKGKKGDEKKALKA